MILKDEISTACPADTLGKALYDPAILTALLPPGCTLAETRPGQFNLTINRMIGPIRLKLRGDVTVAPQTDGQGHVLTLRAAHIVGGKAEIGLAIRITARPKKTIVAYEGEANASGFAGRVLAQYAAAIPDVVKHRLQLMAATAQQGAA